MLERTIRRLAADPKVSIPVVLTLGVMLGITMTVFGVIDAALLRGLPYRDPDGLVDLVSIIKQADGKDVHAIGLPGSQRQRDLRSRLDIFEGIERYRLGAAMTARLKDGPTEVSVGRLGAGMFGLLGIAPEIGRVFIGEDVARGDTAIIGHAFWQRVYGRSPSVIGSTLALDGRSYTIIGVAPEVLRYGVGWGRGSLENDAWIPVDPSWSESTPLSIIDKDVVARLRHGLSLAAARTRLQRVVEQLRRDGPDVWPPNWNLTVEPFGFNNPHASSGVVPTLALAVLFLVTIGSANVASLLLSRTVRRRHDIAVCVALGASRGQLVREALLEGVVLVLAGEVLGLILAFWTIRLLPVVTPPALGAVLFGALSPALDMRAVMFSGAVAALVWVLCVCASSHEAGRVPAAGLRHHGAPSLTLAQRRAFRLFQVIQVGMTTALLVGFALTALSFVRLLYADRGFEVSALGYVGVNVSENDMSRSAELLANAAERVRSVPGVDRVTYGPLPANGSVRVAVSEPANKPRSILAAMFMVPGDYFSTIGLPILAGRSFSPGGEEGQSAALVSASVVRHFWPDRSALGRQITIGGTSMTIVGVVGDMKTATLTAGQASFQVYEAASRAPSRSATMIVHVSGDTEEVLRKVRRMPDDPGGSVRISKIGRIDDLYTPAALPPRFFMLLSGILALSGLLTAVVGLAATLALAVSVRRPEMGIRVALGASGWQVTRLLMQDALAPVAIGLATGTVIAYGLASSLTGVLYGTRPSDPRAYLAVVVLVTVVSAATALVPAWRTGAISATQILRDAR